MNTDLLAPPHPSQVADFLNHESTYYKDLILTITCITTAPKEAPNLPKDGDLFFSTLNTEFEWLCNKAADIEFFSPTPLSCFFNEEGLFCLQQHINIKGMYASFYIQAFADLITMFAEEGIFLGSSHPFALLDVKFSITNENGKEIEIVLPPPPLEVNMPQPRLPAPKQSVRPWEDAPMGLFTCRLTLVGSHIFDDATQAGYDVETVDELPPVFQKTLQRRLRYLQSKAPEVWLPLPLCWLAPETGFAQDGNGEKTHHTLTLTFQCMGMNLLETARLIREQCLYLESRGKFPYGETLAIFAEIQSNSGTWQHVGLLLPEQELHS